MRNDDSSLLKKYNWEFPVPIAYGPGILAEIGQRCLNLHIYKPLIVTDSGSYNLPFISQLKSFLLEAGLEAAVYSSISPNPFADEIKQGRLAYLNGGHDAVIAIGGGSAMDGGKAICLTANSDLDIWAFEFEQPVPSMKNGHAFPKLVTIPTTAGTGAETESTAMITHAGKGMKFCVWHPDLKPSLALLDPRITLGLPRTLTAWTGADALIHAIEAFLVPEFNPLCDAMAMESLSLIAKWLPIAFEQPENLCARGGMLMGSCLAGVAFLKGLGLVHAISHMLGAEFNTQHGLTNAILLPAVLRFNLPGQEEKVRRMAQAMNLSGTSIEEFIFSIEALLDKIDIPKSLCEIGVPIDCSLRIAGKALQDSAAQTNPRTATTTEVCTIIQTAITKAR